MTKPDKPRVPTWVSDAPLIDIPATLQATLRAFCAPMRANADDGGVTEIGCAVVADLPLVIFYSGDEVETHSDYTEGDITLGLVLLNDGGHRLNASDLTESVALPVGHVYRLDGDFEHGTTTLSVAASRDLIFAVMQFPTMGTPDPKAFARVALGVVAELWAQGALQPVAT